MTKPLRYLWLLCTLAVSVCLLATAAALGTLGRLWGRGWDLAIPLGRHHGMSIESSWSGTTLVFDRHYFLLPFTSTHFTLAGLIGLALVFLVVAGIVARPLFQPTGGRNESPASARERSSDTTQQDLLHP